jgi:hypothetical protein
VLLLSPCWCHFFPNTTPLAKAEWVQVGSKEQGVGEARLVRGMKRLGPISRSIRCIERSFLQK